LFRQPHIQKLLSGVMLLLFAFSITSKRFLHDLVADHKDTIACQDNLSAHHIHAAGFYCSCDDLVAESVYMSGGNAIELTVPAVFIEKTPAFSGNYHYISSFFSDLRGPPAAI